MPISNLSSNAGRPIIYHPIMMGCDPELFFERGGQVIGAEKVIPEAGLSYVTPNAFHGKTACFVLDGVQVELNPNPHHCRANLGNELKVAFKALKKHLEGMKEIRASFRSVVELDPTELASLSDKAKVLGCAPSLNHYDRHATIVVDAATYTKRSAGGHIHIGLEKRDYTGNSHLMSYREELVPLMDVLVGLPSVLVDRDPHAAERRKVYGRAGEHRLPKHGLEYRTLSNFWLRSYQLMSFVMGLTRLAVSVLGTKYVHPDPGGYLAAMERYKDNPAIVTRYEMAHKAVVDSASNGHWNAPEKLMKSVNLSMVRDAINGNDFELAKRAFEPVKAFIAEHVSGDLGLNKHNLSDFDHFVEGIQAKGIEYWFPQDPIEHWANLPEGHTGIGWEAFLSNIRTGGIKVVYP